MRKQFVYFAGVLFLMTAAVLAVTAQENTPSLNNTATMNNTTLNVSLNQTQNATPIEPINATSNETMIAAPQASLNETANETLNQTEMNETIPVEMEIVPAQNVTVPVMNETNETIPVEMEIVPAQNVTVSVMNETVAAQNIEIPGSAALNAGPAGNAGVIATGSQPRIAQLGSSAPHNVIVIGGGLKTTGLAELGKARSMMLAPQPSRLGAQA